MLLAGAVLCCAVTPARAMEFTWPSIGSEHETQEQEIDATRTRQAWDRTRRHFNRRAPGIAVRLDIQRTAFFPTLLWEAPDESGGVRCPICFGPTV